MKKRPLSLFLSACLFLYFPMEYLWRWGEGEPTLWFDAVLSVVLPVILLIGLIRVTRVGWYTLVAVVSLWGVRDLYSYYSAQGETLTPLFFHIGIYCLSLGYFINPRVRHVYFDPKMRWWRTKPRFETHLAFMLRKAASATEEPSAFEYPVLRNISEGGCFVETQSLLDVSSTVSLSIPLPIPLGLSVIKTEGEVRWVSSQDKGGMGIQFNNLSKRNHRALKEYVRRQL